MGHNWGTRPKGIGDLELEITIPWSKWIWKACEGLLPFCGCFPSSRIGGLIRWHPNLQDGYPERWKNHDLRKKRDIGEIRGYRKSGKIMICGKRNIRKLAGYLEIRKIMISGKTGHTKNAQVPGNLENHDIQQKRDIRIFRFFQMSRFSHIHIFRNSRLPRSFQMSACPRQIAYSE